MSFDPWLFFSESGGDFSILGSMMSTLGGKSSSASFVSGLLGTTGTGSYPEPSSWKPSSSSVIGSLEPPPEPLPDEYVSSAKIWLIWFFEIEYFYDLQAANLSKNFICLPVSIQSTSCPLNADLSLLVIVVREKSWSLTIDGLGPTTLTSGLRFVSPLDGIG